MTLNFLKNLVHFDVKYNARIVRFFLSASINESLTIRKTAMRVLVFIMIQNKPKFRKVTIDPGRYANRAIDNALVRPGIRDDNRWLLYDSGTAPRSAEAWDEPRFVHDQYTGYYAWPRRLEVYDSPSRQPSAAKRMDELTDTEKEIYEFFSNESNVEKLIKYLSLEEKKGHDQFNAYRFLTFKVSCF